MVLQGFDPFFGLLQSFGALKEPCGLLASCLLGFEHDEALLADHGKCINERGWLIKLRVNYLYGHLNWVFIFWLCKKKKKNSWT